MRAPARRAVIAVPAPISIHRLRAARSAWATIPLRRPFAECPYHDQTGNRRRTEFPPDDSLPSWMTHRPRTSVMLGFLILHHRVAILPGNYCSGGFPTSPGGRRYRFILCCSLLYIYMWDIGVLIAYSLFFSRSGGHIGYGLLSRFTFLCIDTHHLVLRRCRLFTEPCAPHTGTSRSMLI